MANTRVPTSKWQALTAERRCRHRVLVLTLVWTFDSFSFSCARRRLMRLQLVHADVFRPPAKYPMLFCVLVGTGVQLLCMGIVTIAFAAIGYVGPLEDPTVFFSQAGQQTVVVSALCARGPL